MKAVLSFRGTPDGSRPRRQGVASVAMAAAAVAAAGRCQKRPKALTRLWRHRMPRQAAGFFSRTTTASGEGEQHHQQLPLRLPVVTAAEQAELRLHPAWRRVARGRQSRCMAGNSHRRSFRPECKRTRGALGMSFKRAAVGAVVAAAAEEGGRSLVPMEADLAGWGRGLAGPAAVAAAAAVAVAAAVAAAAPTFAVLKVRHRKRSTRLQ